MSGSDWLKTYYGKSFDELKPTVFIDGKEHAVVRLVKGGQMGFVLLTKTGTHGASAYKPLFDGSPNARDMEKMRRSLEEADGD